MGVQVAGSYLHWSQSPSSSFNQSCSIASPSSFSSKRRTQSCHALRRVDRSSLFSQSSNKLLRSASCDVAKLRFRPLPRASSASANLDGFSDEEFAEKLRELALQFSVSEEEDEQSTESSSSSSSSSSFSSSSFSSSTPFVNNTRPTTSPLHLRTSRIESIDPPWLKKMREWGEAAETDEIIPAIERKANSVDIPLSLRIIKKKNQLSQEFLEAGESAVKKAFSSMVFIIRELHSYTLQMREVLFFEDLQGVLARVQEELNASFVWLFQQIFSHTPTLMVSVMILLANFTVHSMANNVALASPLHAAPVSQMEFIQTDSQRDQKFDSSTVKTFSISSSTAPIGGVNGGGGKFNQIASAPDGGDGQFNQISSFNHQMVPEELSKVSSFRSNPTMEPGVNTESQEKIAFDDEMKLWNSMVDEAARMQTIDQETMQQFVRPCSVEIEPEYYSDYYRTELMYEIAVSQNPDNSLLLGNYAQFLYLVNHDYDRAEEYFKLASQVKPADAEAFSNYATFLWIARKDVNAAEENYLEAIEADPGNAYHAATYAHFLWNTGGEDTCYPLGSV